MNHSRDVSFLLLAFVAEVIGTVGGFGSSVFFVPIANVYFDFHTVLGLTAIFHVASNLSKIALFRKGIDKHLVIYLGLPAIVFVAIGGFLSRLIHSEILELVLGVFLILLSGLFLMIPSLVIKKGRKQSIIGGTMSGFAAGFLGTGGAIRGLTMASFNLEKSAFVATSAVIDFAVDFTRAIIYVFMGYLSVSILFYLPFLLAIAVLGSWTGKKILEQIPQKNFRKLSLILIFLTGVLTLINAIF